MVDLVKLEELEVQMLGLAADFNIASEFSKGATCLKTRNALSSARAEIERLREALKVFAAAWNVHSLKPDVLRHLTMGDLGALAKHHVDGIHFKNAAALIREQE